MYKLIKQGNNFVTDDGRKIIQQGNNFIDGEGKKAVVHGDLIEVEDGFFGGGGGTIYKNYKVDTVSVSGFDASIKVIDPEGEEHNILYNDSSSFYEDDYIKVYYQQKWLLYCKVMILVDDEAITKVPVLEWMYNTTVNYDIKIGV